MTREEVYLFIDSAYDNLRDEMGPEALHEEIVGELQSEFKMSDERSRKWLAQYNDEC